MPLRKKPFRFTPWQRRGLKAIIHGFALGYVAWLFLAGITDQLGPDPVLPSPEPIQFRRMIGVYAFVYAFAHLFTYIFFELQLDMALVASEIVSRPYISVGMIALILLVALTATSFKRLQRKMGRKWQTLHNSIYLVLPLALLHFSWSQKTFWQEPVWYWLVGLLLMSPRIKRWYSTYQRKQQGRKSTAKKGRGKENIA